MVTLVPGPWVGTQLQASRPCLALASQADPRQPPILPSPSPTPHRVTSALANSQCQVTDSSHIDSPSRRGPKPDQPSPVSRGVAPSSMPTSRVTILFQNGG